MNFQNAQKQFNENFRLFSDPKNTPDKYNLYAGLENIAAGLVTLRDEVETNKMLLTAILAELQRRPK